MFNSSKIYFPCSLFPLFCKRVANRIPRYKACYPCVTESQIYRRCSKACFSSGTESNVSFRSFCNRFIRAQRETIYFLCSLSVLPERNLSSIMRVARGGAENNTREIKFDVTWSNKRQTANSKRQR